MSAHLHGSFACNVPSFVSWLMVPGTRYQVSGHTREVIQERSYKRGHSRHDHIDPEKADRHHQDHSGQHIGCGEHLDLDHTKTCCQHQEAAAGLKIIDHCRSGVGDDDSAQCKQDEENDKLRDRNDADHGAQGACKDQGCEQIQD